MYYILKFEVHTNIIFNKKSRIKNLRDLQFKMYSVVYYFAFAFSFSSSLSLSDGFQTFTSESFVILDPGRI